MDKAVLQMIGRRIREIRNQKKLSQEELGELAGFHFSYIGGVERAEKNITLLNLQKISDALDVPVHELFLFGRHLQKGNSDKDRLINELILKVAHFKESDIKRIILFIDEFFKSK